MPKGKSSTQTTTSTTEPPSYIREPLKYGLSEAQRLYDAGSPAFFSGQTYAGFTPQQEQALQLTQDRAMAGSPLVRTAQEQLQRTLSGEFLNANPYLDPMVDAATRGARQSFTETVMPSIQSSLGRSGRYGNNAATQQLYTNAQRTLAQQLADTEANIRGQAYGVERQLMNAAIGQAPALAEQDYADLGKLAAVGEQRQAMEQAGINEAMQRYQYENTIDQQMLDQFLARVTGASGAAGNTTTQVAPKQGSSPFSQMLGLGATLGGAALGSPWLGTALGFGTQAAISARPAPTMIGGPTGSYSMYNSGPVYWNN